MHCCVHAMESTLNSPIVSYRIVPDGIMIAKRCRLLPNYFAQCPPPTPSPPTPRTTGKILHTCFTFTTMPDC